MNKKDIEIAKILSFNARISYRKIAKILDISPKQVINRVQKLKKNLLPSSCITLNLEKLGFIGQAIFLIQISYQNDFEKIFSQIIKLENVIVAIKTFGFFNIMATVPFSHFNEIFKIEEKISKIEGIKEIEILFDKPFEAWPLNIWSQLL